jgi:hypothetical protein
MSTDGGGAATRGSGGTRVSELGETVGRLKSQLKAMFKRAKEAEAARDAAIGERDAAAEKAEKAEADYNAEPLKGEVDRLKQEIRVGKHRAAFDEAARGAGAQKDALDLLWRESGWKAEKDEVDPAALGEAVKALKGRPDVAPLFGEAAPTPETRLAPAKGQGNRVGEGNRVKATQADLRDHDWAWQNRAALRERRVDVVD